MSMKMDEAKEIKRLLPMWRKTCIETHNIVDTTFSMITFPLRWLREQLDGTADLRRFKMEEEEKREEEEVTTLKLIRK